MTPATSPFGVPSPEAAASIDTDIPCRRCGYNLRGLREAMACPECGTAVGLSTQGDFLRYADPIWVETIARGATLIVWTILGQFAALALGIWSASATGDTLVLSLLTYAVSLITAVGVWRLTARDTGQIERDHGERTRELTRTTLIVNLGISALTIAGTQLPPGRNRDVLLLLLGLVVGLIAAASTYYLYLYVQHLTSRVPDDLLSRRAKVLRFALVGVLVPAAILEAITGIYTLAQGSTGNRVVVNSLQFAGMILGFVAFSISIVSIFFLVHFARRLREQARSARLSWAAQSAFPQAG